MRISRSIMSGSAAALLALPGLATAQIAAGTASGAAPSSNAQQSSSGMQATPGGVQQTGSPSEATAAPTGGSPKLAQGATVYDTNGGTVGTVQSVTGDMVVLATSKNKVQLPKTSFALGAKGPVIGMTAAQVDQAAAQAMPQGGASAAAKPNVVKGAAVADTQGGQVGTIADVDAQFATVELTSGTKVRLPVSAFGAGEDGGLRVAMTAAQLSAAAGVSKGGV